MGCALCKGKKSKENEEEAYKRNFFYKLFLFLIGILIITIIIPIEYFFVFSVTFLNKNSEIDLLGMIAKIFSLKKK